MRSEVGMMSGQAMLEAMARKRDWESHGPGHWGYGVAIDLLALERRVSALERLSDAGKSAGEDSDSPGEGWRWVREGEVLCGGDEFLPWGFPRASEWRPITHVVGEPCQEIHAYRRRIDAKSNHDAAPAARAQSGSTRADNAGTLPRLGTGDTQDEPVAFAVMSGGRAYDIYDTLGEAKAICRWLREDESGDIWRVVPLVPADATPESHDTYGECSLQLEGTPQPAITDAELDALYHGTAVLLYEGHTREAGSEGSRNLLKIAATLKGLRERLEGCRE